MKNQITTENQITTYKPIRHIAFIMDGNGRWAKARLMPRSFGHREGVKRIKEVVKLCIDHNIEVMTLFCFSTENWKRDKDEVDYLFKLFDEFFHKEIGELNENGCQVRVMGEIHRLPESTQRSIARAKEITKNNKKFILNICLSYGGRDEIVTAAKDIAKKVKEGKINIEDIDENLFENHMMCRGLPQCDLMVRTSGEQRISNFILWEIAYAELVFIKEPWPDFKEKQFKRALEEYTKRDRRFGGIKNGNE